MWTILPSYSMYESTFYGQQNPPEYEESINGSESISQASNHSSATTPTLISEAFSNPLGNSSLNLTSPSLIVADENTCSWRETILDNIHNLRNFTDSDNSVSNQIEISVHFSEDVGQQGKIPKHIDPLIFEYKQGDYLNGYIVLENRSSEPISFEMFYVLFEGNFEIRKSEKTTSTVRIKKFLEMYDFAASWNQSSVDRLITEECNQFTCQSKVDPTDNTALCINRKCFEPGRKFKRFFTFKIPDKLLDSECNEHNLPGHTELPPTVGVSTKEKKLANKKMTPVTDFSFIDASTSYAVLARVIGRASQIKVGEADFLETKLINSTGDEFVIMKESMSFIRILQDSNCPSEAQKAVNREASRILYENFISRIKEKLKIGDLLKAAIERGDDLTAVDISARIAEEEEASGLTDAIKARQSYTCYRKAAKHIFMKRLKEVNLTTPLYKKSFLRPDKVVGTFTVSSLMADYLLNYMQPERFRSEAATNDDLWKLQIPINVAYSPSVTSSGKIPKVCEITCELIVFTLKSEKKPIPVELNHGFLFKNALTGTRSLKLTDNYDHIVKRPMQRYSRDLYNLFQELGAENFRIEKSLAEDVVAMATAESKYNNLVLRETKILCLDGSVQEAEKCSTIPLIKLADGNYSNNFTLLVDATKAQKKQFPLKNLPVDYKSFNEFCLVPSFQTCLFSRMYYLKIFIRLSTDDVVELKLPVTIAKMPSA